MVIYGDPRPSNTLPLEDFLNAFIGLDPGVKLSSSHFFIFNQAEVNMEFFNFNQIPPNEWKLIPMNNLHFTKWENVIFVTAPSNEMGLQ